LLTLATTIGESDVAGAPSIVEPDARLRIRWPSRTTVIVTAGFAAASRSNAWCALTIAGTTGGVVVLGVVVVLVVVVLVVDVVVLLVVDVVVVVVVVVLVVVLVVVVLVVVVLALVVDGSGSEPAADGPAHPAAPRRQPTAMIVSCPRTTPR
jgi:hypothetical protein